MKIELLIAGESPDEIVSALKSFANTFGGAISAPAPAAGEKSKTTAGEKKNAAGEKKDAAAAGTGGAKELTESDVRLVWTEKKDAGRDVKDLSATLKTFTQEDGTPVNKFSVLKPEDYAACIVKLKALTK